MKTRHQNYATGILFIITVLLNACSSGGSAGAGSGGSVGSGDSSEGDSGDNGSLPTRSWGTAELINTGSSGSAEYQQIAMNAVGNVIAVWTQKSGDANNIWARNYNADSGWEQPALIGGYHIAVGSYPYIAINNTGNAFAVWSQESGNGASDNIWANQFTTENGWATAEIIEPEGGSSTSPKIAINASGNAYVLWEEFTNNGNTIFSNTYIVKNPLGALAPTGWGTEEIFTADTGLARSPEIATKTNGGLFAVWSEYNGFEYNIWARTSTYSALTGTSWGTAELIKGASGNVSNPQISHDGNGNAFAVWSQYDGFMDNIWANRYTAGIGWSTAELIESSDFPAVYPHIDIAANGDAVAIWSNYDSSISTNRYSTDSGWGTAELIETADDGSASSPQIVIDANGNAMAVWSKSDSSGGKNIWARQYTSESGWGVAEMIEVPLGKRSGIPRVVIDAFGDAMVVWKQFGDGRTDIWANRFE